MEDKFFNREATVEQVNRTALCLTLRVYAIFTHLSNPLIFALNRHTKEELL
jgi:hypothetical protein